MGGNITGFLIHFIQTFLDKWAIPIAVGIFVVIFTGHNDENRGTLLKKAVPFFAAIIVTTLLLTITSNRFDSTKAISITDRSFVTGVVGLASLYDENLMPIWFEDDLEEPWLAAEIDNIGTSYANIVHTKLIVDDFRPLALDDILLFKSEAFAGTPSVAEANVDLTEITDGRSEYDVNFETYAVNEYGASSGEGRTLKKGETFYVDQSSRIRLITGLKLNKTGIYTYHFVVEYEYYKKEDTLETNPMSFIYIADNQENYVFNSKKLDSFHIENKCEYEGNSLFYDIDGRTLRIHDCKSVFRENDFSRFFSLINTIVVEDGVLEINLGAFGDEPGLCRVTSIYLPESLEGFNPRCIINYGLLKTIYYGGSEEKWKSLIQKEEDRHHFNLDGVEIVFNYGTMPSKESLRLKQQNDANYYKLLMNTDD